MFYFKQKNYSLLKVVSRKDLPGYVKHYVHDDEIVLATYKTTRDHGAFTDSKLVLFDNELGRVPRKKIYSITYKSISAIDITFEEKRAIMNLLLDNGYMVQLQFINVEPEDKIRLRLLYTCINRISSNQELIKEDVEKLLENKFRLKKRD